MDYWSRLRNLIRDVTVRVRSELMLDGLTHADVTEIARQQNARGNLSVVAAVDEAKKKAKDRKKRRETTLRWEQPRRIIPEPPQQIQQGRAPASSGAESITPPVERLPDPWMMARMEATTPARTAEPPAAINWAERFETAYQEIRTEREAREAAEPVTALHNAERGDGGRPSIVGAAAEPARLSFRESLATIKAEQAAELSGAENRPGTSELGTTDWAAQGRAALASIKAERESVASQFRASYEAIRAEREAADEERTAGRPAAHYGQSRPYGHGR